MVSVSGALRVAKGIFPVKNIFAYFPTEGVHFSVDTTESAAEAIISDGK